ncbi:hypothetical protein BROUX41_003151 [Berkeleyomyces rouxiae]
MPEKNRLAKMREKEAEYMRAHAEGQAQAQIAGDAPPPYTGVDANIIPQPAYEEAGPSHLPAHTLTDTSADVFARFAPATSLANHLFPATFGVYESILSRTRTIGPHKSEPMLCIREHMRVKAGFDLVLHNGPDASFEPLAGLTQKFFKRGFSISLPARTATFNPTRDRDQVFYPGSLDVTEQVEPAAPSIMGRKLEFTIEVGRVRETFQWRVRKSSGYSLRNRRHYILLRRAVDRPPDGAPPGSWPPISDKPLENDGSSSVLGDRDYEDMEIVACWDTEAIRGTKLTTFKFLGTGASGLLGPRWEIMAVLSGLHICITEVDQSATGAS